MQIKTRPAPGNVTLKAGQDRSRNDDQKAIDAELGKTVAAYQKAGAGKTPVESRPRVAFAVAPEDKTELKGMVRRAANLHKVTPLFFTDTPDEETGEVVVTLTVGPPVAKNH